MVDTFKKDESHIAPRDLPSIGYFEGREHRYPLRVFYEDTDFSGVVYYANYLRFLERARSSFFRLAGVGHAELLERDPPLAFVIRKINLDYKASAKIDDVLSVVTTYDVFKGARLLVTQKIFRGEQLILTADSEAACIDLDGRPRRAPKEMMEKLRPFLAT
ncbi:tol-pal system-associated acyl-CoA thioesterase [Litorimonas cladophorae]|uniref:Tol-pal system-associated acyl-CoA thioesterase n=1 Tax=Litorimonas cladophorae TaxID=1220491 RepID=A0A918KCJ6_9PROT|nr:YbgC/FadM family acyl-CoA thioesterase [Litorimonas cladophorae]GGX56617.1 tol-pal system-associated acyl-CoA thioesterase [Litorimonas cladophorae]